MKPLCHTNTYVFLYHWHYVLQINCWTLKLMCWNALLMGDDEEQTEAIINLRTIEKQLWWSENDALQLLNVTSCTYNQLIYCEIATLLLGHFPFKLGAKLKKTTWFVAAFRLAFGSSKHLFPTVNMLLTQPVYTQFNLLKFKILFSSGRFCVIYCCVATLLLSCISASTVTRWSCSVSSPLLRFAGHNTRVTNVIMLLRKPTILSSSHTGADSSVSFFILFNSSQAQCNTH